MLTWENKNTQNLEGKSKIHLGTEWVKDDITRENFQKYLK